MIYSVEISKVFHTHTHAAFAVDTLFGFQSARGKNGRCHWCRVWKSPVRFPSLYVTRMFDRSRYIIIIRILAWTDFGGETWPSEGEEKKNSNRIKWNSRHRPPDIGNGPKLPEPPGPEIRVCTLHRFSKHYSGIRNVMGITYFFPNANRINFHRTYKRTCVIFSPHSLFEKKAP